MKRFLQLTLVAALVMTVIPISFLKSGDALKNTGSETDIQETSNSENTESADTVTVFRSVSKESETTDLFEYVCGSVAAEMPLSYDDEALKAQAVACRTNVLRLKNSGKSYNDADISDDSSVHQGYIDKEERKSKWGGNYEKYESKLENIVKSTENQVLYYDGELCVAAFFAISAGTTENAENIWGQKVPYLVSVKSNGDSLSPQYQTEVSFSADEFKKCADTLGAKIKDNQSMKNIVKITDKTKAGTVICATVNGKEFSGDEIRKAFSLKSGVFTVKTDKTNVTFTVKGSGHGVGMSQYGADFMARQGSTYKEILTHYYKSAEIKEYSGETD